MDRRLICSFACLTVAATHAAENETDPYAKSGNIPPKAVQLSPEKEAEILKDVKVADGFDVTVFAAPPKPRSSARSMRRADSCGITTGSTSSTRRTSASSSMPMATVWQRSKTSS